MLVQDQKLINLSAIQWLHATVLSDKVNHFKQFTKPNELGTICKSPPPSIIKQ